MSGGTGTDSSSEPVNTATAVPKQQRRRKARGRKSVWADIQPANFWMWKILSSPIDGDVVINTSKGARGLLRAQMDLYFDAPIEIFPTRDPNGQAQARAIRSFLSSLKPGFMDLWPEHLEMRLKRITEAKFGPVDHDVRSLIGELKRVSAHNLSWFIFWKRLYQLVAVTSVLLVAYGFIQGKSQVFSMLGLTANASSNFVHVFVSLAVFLGISAGIVVIFRAANSLTNFKVYRHALDKSVDVVANKIKDRMSSLNSRYLECVNRLDGLRVVGQKIADNADNLGDDELKDGDGFFHIQLLQWLAKRVQYLELHLFHEMQTTERKHAHRDVVGWAAWLAILIGSLIPVPWIVGAGHAYPIAIGVAAVAANLCISWWSYCYQGWNVGEDILERQFETKTKDWKTFNKFNLDQTLGARYERAIDRIRHQDDQISKK